MINMDCLIKIPRYLLAMMFTSRLASHSLQSNSTLSAHNTTIENEHHRRNEIPSNSKSIEIPRVCAVEARVGPLTKSIIYGSLSHLEFVSNSLARLQTWGCSNNTTFKKPLYNEPTKRREFEQPHKFQVVNIELNSDRDQKVLDVQNFRNEHPQSESKVEKTHCLLKCSQTEVQADVLPGQMPERTMVEPYSPISKEQGDGNLINLNLDSTKLWNPNRSQRLKRKYYSWAAIQAAGSYSCNGNIGGRGGRNNGNGNVSNGNQQRRPASLPHDIPMYVTQAPSQFDRLGIDTYIQQFTAIPGDIVLSQECRPIEQNNPHFNPGGHCYLYTDQDVQNRDRYLTGRARREAIVKSKPEFQPNDLIVRAGKIEYAFNWIPQRNVELFRYLGVDHPAPWLLVAKVPFQQLREPITYATGDSNLQYRAMHAFQPPEVRLFGCTLGFAPQQGDLIVREALGFNKMQISYYDRSRTELEPSSILLRAGYGRVENSLVATVEMYQYMRNPASEQMGWIFQGRDIQIYGGTQTLDSLIQFMEPHAVVAPRLPPTRTDIALADSYLRQ